MSSPCIAVGRELLRRGHDVRIAVPPDLVDFAGVGWAGGGRIWAGCAGVAGRAPRVRDAPFAKFLAAPGPDQVGREDWALFAQCWKEIGATLTSLADGADLLFTSVIGEPARGQCRGVLRHSVGHTACVPNASQQSPRSQSAIAVDPLRHDCVGMGAIGA